LPKLVVTPLFREGRLCAAHIQLSMTDIADEYRRVVEELQRRYRVD